MTARPATASDPDPRPRQGLLTTDEAAALLGVPPYRLRRMRAGNVGPAYIAFGRTIRYSPGALRRYIEVNTVRPDEHG